MTSLVVINIERSFKRNKTVTPTEARILLQQIETQDNRIKELEREIVRLANELAEARAGGREE
jgi:hypothetical protein